MKKKKEVSSVVSEAGVYLSLMTELDRRVRLKGGTFDDWHRLVKPEGEDMLDRIADLIVSGNPDGVYPVSIQKASLEEMIAVGHYNWVDSKITAENFPLDDSQFGDFKLVLVHLNRNAITPELLALMQKRDLELAKTAHLLCFGAKYPDLQREFPIVALGSYLLYPDGLQSVLYLGGDCTCRDLNLLWDNSPWISNFRFLAFRK